MQSNIVNGNFGARLSSAVFYSWFTHRRAFPAKSQKNKIVLVKNGVKGLSVDPKLYSLAITLPQRRSTLTKSPEQATRPFHIYS
jgi:hypothetical protein